MCAFMAMTASAADKPLERRVVNPLVYRALQYAFPDEHYTQPGAAASVREVPRMSLGSFAPDASPGRLVGNTWYDYQHNGSMGRMIAAGTSAAGDTLVQGAFMTMPGASFDAREFQWWGYDFFGETPSTTGLQSDDDYAGYVGIDLTNDQRAVVGGHNKEAVDGLNDSHFYWDFAPGTGFFGANHQVPRGVAESGGAVGQEVIWPKFRYVEGTNDTVLYVFSQVSEDDPGAPQAIYFFRRVGSDLATGVWDDPPMIVDTIYDISQDVAASDNGKVALVWTANLPCPGDPNPLASGYECRQFVQWDNDIYYMISTDYGASFSTRVNLTNNRLTEGIADGYRPYTDLSALLDNSGNLHIVFGAMFWPADANTGGEAGVLRGRMFHWSENQPYLRTAHDYMWDQTTCNGGGWQLNASKMSISECNGKFYILFVQFNDIPNGVEDDCADEGNPDYPVGAANGELFVVVSADGGLTWDRARNLTNTYTPGCDSAIGAGGACGSEHWPSMSKYASNFSQHPADTFPVVVVPAGGSDNGNYLDVQYIHDYSAGGVVQDEGTWQQADVMWFRMACVAEVPNPLIAFQPNVIDFPAWTKHGVQKDTNVVLENLGNAALTYSVSLEEDVAPAGWLTKTGFSGNLPAGLGNTETAVLHLNTGGIVNNPGSVKLLAGRVVFTSNAPTTPDTLPIRIWVADTLFLPEIDTISTNCLSLAVLNNGSFGNQGSANGKVNMDYYDDGDCDTTATVYLYDGSPVIGWIDGNDTVMNWSIFGNTFVDSVGFIQLANSGVLNDGTHEYYTAKFLTNDSSICIEKTWFAPTGVAADDTCNFIIQCLKVYENDDQDHLGITFGEAVDWDIPADSGADNGSGFITSKNLIYQQGAEYNQDDTTECVDNDTRYGAISFLQMLKKVDTFEVIDDGEGRPFHGAYTKDNATYVFGNTNGFDPGELYTNMQDGGYSTYSSSNSDSTYVDLHMVMTFVNEYDLLVGETLIVYINLITVPDGGSQADLEEFADQDKGWFCEKLTPVGCGCCQNRGNVDGQFEGIFPVTVSDLTYLVGYLFSGGPAPPS
jgi:hypothetical protein